MCGFFVNMATKGRFFFSIWQRMCEFFCQYDKENAGIFINMITNVGFFSICQWMCGFFFVNIIMAIFNFQYVSEFSCLFNTEINLLLICKVLTNVPFIFSTLKNVQVQQMARNFSFCCLFEYTAIV